MISENPKTTILFAYTTSFLSQACSLGFNLLVFRQFSLEEVGTYGLIMSIVAFAGFFMDLGLSPILIRGFSQKRLGLEQALAGSLVLRLPVFLAGCLVFLWYYFYSKSISPQVLTPLALAIAAQFLLTSRAIATSWLRAGDQQKLANFLEFLRPLSYLATGLVLVFTHRFNLAGFFLGLLLAEGLITVLTFWTIRQRPERQNLREFFGPQSLKSILALLWKPSLVFSAIGLCVIIQNRLDWILVYAYVSKTELAYYSFANKTYEIFNSFMAVLIQTSFPWMCKLIPSKADNPKLTLGLKGIAVSGMFLAGLAALYLPGLLRLIFGAKYAPANHLIFLFMLGACFATVGSLLYNLLVSLGKENIPMIAALIGVFLQVLLILVLIPKYGSLGATIGMLFGIIVVIGIMVIGSISTSSFITVNLKILRIIMTAITFVVSIIALSVVNPNYHLLKLIIFITTMVFLSFFVLLSKEERGFCYSLLLK